MQSFKLTQPLAALSSLALHRVCEFEDAESHLLQMPNLKVSFDTITKAYHGEWWNHLTSLRTKCSRKAALGVRGQYPDVLEVLQLHTESPEPVSVTTAKVAGQPGPYPHKARALHVLRSFCLNFV